MQNPFLIGEKIYLRPLEKEDAPAIVPWFNDQDILRVAGRYLPLNLDREKEFLEKLYKEDKDILLGIVMKENDKLIGVTGLHRIKHKDRNAEFGILIGAKDEWNKGYGTEATRLIVQYGFHRLNLHRIYLLVNEHNPAAIKVYEKVGFKKEGAFREAFFLEGKYYDQLLMGILREEWENSQPGDVD